MHPDLPRLLELQQKDRRLAELRLQADAIAEERAALDALLARVRAELAAAERSVADSARRRDEAEQKLETQRVQHDRRRQRLEQERNPRLAAQLLADVELGRTILAQEETDWLRLSEEASARTRAHQEIAGRVAAAEAEQAAARAVISGRAQALQQETDGVADQREQAASQLDRALRNRYDRLRKSRNADILVAADHGTCTACYTAIPRSKLGKLHADGLLIDGCEMCGAMIYVAEPVS